MRQRGRSTAKGRDYLENILNIIRQLNNERSSSTHSTVVDRLRSECKITADCAESALEYAIRQGRIIEDHATTKPEPILEDVLRLKVRRQLRLTPSFDLAVVVQKCLMEKGARSSQEACSTSDLQDYIVLTHDIQENTIEHLAGCLDKAIKALLKREKIEAKLPLHDNETRYFLTSAPSPISNSNALNSRPSTSAEIDVPHRERRISKASDGRKSSCEFGKKRKSEYWQQPVATQYGPDGASKSEVKSLQDSLSAFFTPTNVRRSRVAQSSFSLENFNDAKTPLEILVNGHDHPDRIPKASDSSMDMMSLNSTPSPNRHTDRLVDSLSPYFSANHERRRKHEKGEYLQMCNGVANLKRKPQSGYGSENEKSDVESNRQKRQTLGNIAVFLNEQSPFEIEAARGSSPRRSSGRKTADSNYFARKESGSTVNGMRTRPPTRTMANRVSVHLLKRARQHCHGRNTKETTAAVVRAPSVLPTTPKKSRPAAEPASSTVVNHALAKQHIKSPIRRGSFSPAKGIQFPKVESDDEEPSVIPKSDEQLFQKTRMIVQKRMDENSRLMYEKGEEGIFPSRIRIGHFEIQTWYSSPYPQEYACLPLLYVCERCLMYMCNDVSHGDKCKLKCPPGNEIYRCDGVSVFEVDGNMARVYCRNLCLLAKLFMDHKTLYFDVEPFLFYVLTVTDQHGCHFVGYFSKEKYSHQQFNLACIVTLPCYQKKGYGRFLIDFSYLLSRRESMLGTPERPLSNMGRIAYNSYWRTAIFEYFYQRKHMGKFDSLSAMEIARATGIVAHDIVDIMKSVGFLSIHDSNLSWTIDWNVVEKHWTQAKSSSRRIWLDESKLKWTPKVYSPQMDYFARSPNTSPRRLMASGTDTESEKKKNPTRRLLPVSPTPPARKHSSTSQSKNLQAAVLQKKKNSSKKGRVQSKNGSAPLRDDDSQRVPQLHCEVRPNPDENDDVSSRLPNGTVPSAYTYRQRKVISSSGSDSESEADITRNDFLWDSAKLERKKSSGSTAAKSLRSRDKVKAPNKSYRDRRRSFSTNSSGDNRSQSSTRSAARSVASAVSSVRSAFASNGVIGRKKLPVEVEKAQQRTQTKQSKTIILDDGSESDRSKEEDPDFTTHIERSSSFGGKRQRTAAKKKPASPAKRPVSRKNEKEIPEETAKPTPQPRSGKKTPKSAAKKKSPAKVQPSTKRKSPAKSAQHHPESQHNTEDEDDACRSSASPPPIGERRTRHSLIMRSSVNCDTGAETMNMGGEPDTVNMGGEPDEEFGVHTPRGFLPSQTPKAPKPHPVVGEDEEMDHTDGHAVAYRYPHRPPVYAEWAENANPAPNPYPTSSHYPHIPFEAAPALIPKQPPAYKPATSPEEMPILRAGSPNNAPALDDDDDDSPPNLSPMPQLSPMMHSRHSPEPNTAPGSIEPPKLESAANPPPFCEIPAAAVLPTTPALGTSFEQNADSFGSISSSASIPSGAQNKSPNAPAFRMSNPHDPIFSPQNRSEYTPNSFPPMSHNSNGSAPEMSNASLEIMSPPVLQKSNEQLPGFTQQQTFSPAKAAIKLDDSNKMTNNSGSVSARRRNTTDGTPMKAAVPPVAPPTAGLGGQQAFHLMPFVGPYFMQNSNIPTTAQFTVPTAEQPQSCYDYVAQQAGYSFYNGNWHSAPYPGGANASAAPNSSKMPFPGMLGAQMPNTAAGMMSAAWYLQNQQQQQQPIPPAAMVPSSFTAPFANPALANAAAMAHNNAGTAPLYYNGYG